MKYFRLSHLSKLLALQSASTQPLDLILRNYFKVHKAIGSKDRKILSETVYGMTRWKGLLDYLHPRLQTAEEKWQLFEKVAPLNYLKDETIPLHVRLSFPEQLVHKLLQSYGEKKVIEYCLISNQAAPTTVRVNCLKISRDTLLERWKNLYEVSPCRESPEGITFHKRVNFYLLPEFKEGLFEVQDEGSQIVAQKVEAKKNEHVFDYCAGSGGKTLAFAPKMEGKGQIYLYDMRPFMLLQAKKRLKRAGVQNALLLEEKQLKRKGLLKRMDWILLDVPCSGTGTFRRNPDQKWKTTPETIDRLVEEQRKIFEESLKFLHPKGKIIYATCSVMPEENQQQIDYVTKKYGLKVVSTPFSSFPKEGGMDGFFCSTLSF